MTTKRTAISSAILAAALYAINLPLSKLLLKVVSPTMMAALLYLGAGLGLLLFTGRKKVENPLTRAELPFTIGMIVLDIAAPILLMFGLRYTGSANASLLNNFEIVATSLIALLVFREVLSRRLWLAILLVTLASILLSFEGEDAFQFNRGSLLVLGASVCWGFENNCTRRLSSKSSVQITTIKGIFSGLGSLVIALCIGETIPGVLWIGATLLLGFVAYGLSIHFYIMAQNHLGAAKTSAYYAISPFLGVAFSMLFLGERPTIRFFAAFAIMIAGTILMVRDTFELQKVQKGEEAALHIEEHSCLYQSEREKNEK